MVAWSMNNELRKIRPQLRYFPGICVEGLRKIHNKPQFGEFVSGPRFELWTSPNANRSYSFWYVNVFNAKYSVGLSSFWNILVCKESTVFCNLHYSLKGSLPFQANLLSPSSGWKSVSNLWMLWSVAFTQRIVNCGSRRRDYQDYCLPSCHPEDGSYRFLQNGNDLPYYNVTSQTRVTFTISTMDVSKFLGASKCWF